MRVSVWLAGMVAVSGCAAAYEAEPVELAAPRPAEVRPAASPSQPGCQEPVHQPFPPSGSYVAVDELPETIITVPPAYPDGRTVGVEGTVLVRALVCEHGRVVKTEVVRSIPMLDEAAREAVVQWTFRPARRGGQPVGVWVDTPVRFIAK